MGPGRIIYSDLVDMAQAVACSSTSSQADVLTPLYLINMGNIFKPHCDEPEESWDLEFYGSAREVMSAIGACVDPYLQVVALVMVKDNRWLPVRVTETARAL